MGMDGVELVMLAEERFGIEIKDQEAQAIRTPRMFIDLIFGKLEQATSSRCQSQRSFYVLRRALVSVSGANRNSISPGTPIRSFVARIEERRFWERLRQQIGARSWPDLGYAASLETAGKLGFFLLSILGVAAGWRFGLLSSAGGTAVTILFLGLFLPAAMIHALSRLLTGFKNSIPTQISTVQDLIHYAATSDRIDWSREDVAQAVRQIVENVLAPGERYREDADFVRDLGLS